MGASASSLPPPQVEAKKEPEVKVAEPEIVAPAAFELSVVQAQDYLGTRVPAAFAIGGLTGVASGYYVGELAGLYGYSGAFGLGIASTAFYGTTYLLRCARQKEDTLNFAISGGVNGFWIAAGLTRSGARGLVGSVVGAAAGVGIKLGGEWLYTTSRGAWLNHRVQMVGFGRPRLLEARKPMFHPRDSRLPTSGNIIPTSSESVQKPLSPPVEVAPKATAKSSTSTSSKGWLW